MLSRECKAVDHTCYLISPFNAGQAIGFVHRDKEHRHLHLVINKVKDPHLKLYHDGFIGKRTQKVADRIATEMNLIRAAEIRQQNILERRRKKELAPSIKPVGKEQIVGSKQLFKQQVKEILQNSGVKSVPGYFKALEAAGFKVYLYHNKQTGELRGYGIERNNTKMDASQISKDFTITRLTERFVALKEKANRKYKRPSKPKKPENQLLQPLTDGKKIKILEEYLEVLKVPKRFYESQRIASLEQGERYYIGIKNDSGGYMLYNTFSKTEYGKEDITTIIESTDAPIIVVEDFFDYAKLKQENESEPLNYIILHSLNNRDKAIEKLSALNPEAIFVKLKNDRAGKAVTDEFLETFPEARDLNKRKEPIPEIIASRQRRAEIETEENDYPRRRGFRM